jgi:hypothetical protein
LTNTCLQPTASSAADAELSTAKPTVRLFQDLVLPDKVRHSALWDAICLVTGDLFEAAAREMPTHFQPTTNAFEVFGLDFLVDAAGTPWLLEVNAFPDFKQTGGDLSEIVEGFWRAVMKRGVARFFGVEVEDREDAMVAVREIDLGRR